jgi:hypothetical protein
LTPLYIPETRAIAPVWRHCGLSAAGFIPRVLFSRSNAVYSTRRSALAGSGAPLAFDGSGVKAGPIRVQSDGITVRVDWRDDTSRPWTAEFSLDPEQALIRSIYGKSDDGRESGPPSARAKTAGDQLEISFDGQRWAVCRRHPIFILSRQPVDRTAGRRFQSTNWMLRPSTMPAYA